MAITRDGKPTNSALLLEAAEGAFDEGWQAAHVIVQGVDTDAVAAWIHAVVDRMEGDIGSALYWHRRCRRALREGVSTDGELRGIKSRATELTDRNASQEV